MPGRFWVLVSCAVLAGYLALLAGPLRLGDDSITYLCIAAEIADGVPVHDEGLPRGYPLALAVLEKSGLGSSAGIVALNLASMAVGLACTHVVLRRELALSPAESWTICLLSALSWIFVRLAVVPMSELFFFALASSCLALLAVARSIRGPQWLLPIGGATVLAAAAVTVRSIGAAALVSVLFAVGEKVVARFRLSRVAVIGGLATVVVVAAVAGILLPRQLAGPRYAGVLEYLAKPDWLAIVEDIGWWRVQEIGAIADNLSADGFHPTVRILPADSTSPWVVAMTVVQSLGMAAGLIAVPLVVIGLVSGLRGPPSAAAFFITYFGILSIWPFDAVRFLAPVVPLLLAYGWIGLCRLPIRPERLKKGALAYAAVFSVCGAVAIGSYVRMNLGYGLYPWSQEAEHATATPERLRVFQRFGGVITAAEKRELGPVPLTPNTR